MSEQNKLANIIALDAAISWLAFTTVTVDVDGVKWQDIDGEMDGVPLGGALKKELRYLTLRDVLVWHPDRPNLFRIVKAEVLK